jgi:hypothetical protein
MAVLRLISLRHSHRKALRAGPFGSGLGNVPSNILGQNYGLTGGGMLGGGPFTGMPQTAQQYPQPYTGWQQQIPQFPQVNPFAQPVVTHFGARCANAPSCASPEANRSTMID